MAVSDVNEAILSTQYSTMLWQRARPCRASKTLPCSLPRRAFVANPPQHQSKCFCRLNLDSVAKVQGSLVAPLLPTYSAAIITIVTVVTMMSKHPAVGIILHPILFLS